MSWLRCMPGYGMGEEAAERCCRQETRMTAPALESDTRPLAQPRRSAFPVWKIGMNPL